MAEDIGCRDCRFARQDETFSEPGWMAIQCANRESEYYRALLNVTEDGDQQNSITWAGCPLAERGDA